MRNTRASLKKYHLAKFFVADLNPTENICFSRCKKWSKTSKMYETNYSDKRSFKLWFLHNFTALISVIAILFYEAEVDVLVLKS